MRSEGDSLCVKNKDRHQRGTETGDINANQPLLLNQLQRSVISRPLIRSKPQDGINTDGE